MLFASKYKHIVYNNSSYRYFPQQLFKQSQLFSISSIQYFPLITANNSRSTCQLNQCPQNTKQFANTFAYYQKTIKNLRNIYKICQAHTTQTHRFYAEKNKKKRKGNKSSKKIQ